MRIKHISSKLKHQIKFLENIATNQVTQDKWQEKITTYAEIISISDASFQSIETLNFGHIMTEAYFIFRIRFIKDITTKMRILFKERQFEIKRIINVEEVGRVLQIVALEI